MATATMGNPQGYRAHASRDIELSVNFGDFRYAPSPQSIFDPDQLQRALESEQFAALMNEIHGLLVAEDEEDRPSQTALTQMLNLIPAASIYLQRVWRKPRAVPDGDGGLRLTWKHGSKEVRAIIPGMGIGGNYLYIQEDSNHWAIPDFTKMTLCNELAWLYQG